MKQWGMAPSRLESRRTRVIAPILAAVAVVSLIDFWFFDGSGWIAILALLAEAGLGLYYRKPVGDVAGSVDQPEKDLEILSLVLARLEREQFRSEKLRELRAALDTDGKQRSSGWRPPASHRKRLKHVREKHAVENCRHQCGPRPCRSAGARKTPTAVGSSHRRHNTSFGFAAGRHFAILCGNSATARHHGADQRSHTRDLPPGRNLTWHEFPRPGSGR